MTDTTTEAPTERGEGGRFAKGNAVAVDRTGAWFSRGWSRAERAWTAELCRALSEAGWSRRKARARANRCAVARRTLEAFAHVRAGAQSLRVSSAAIAAGELLELTQEAAEAGRAAIERKKAGLPPEADATDASPLAELSRADPPQENKRTDDDATSDPDGRRS